MSGEQLGFELTEPRPGGVRRTDPATSRAAATDHASMVRWGSQRSALLQAFADAPPGGLLDEEASCSWLQSDSKIDLFDSMSIAR